MRSAACVADLLFSILKVAQLARRSIAIGPFSILKVAQLARRSIAIGPSLWLKNNNSNANN